MVSRKEKEIRSELEGSKESLLNHPERERMRAALKCAYGDFKSGVILNWIPEERSDIFVVLVSDQRVIQVELDRLILDAEPIVENIALKDYKTGLKKAKQFQLKIALEVLGA